MRMSIGAGIGPVRVSQRIGMPRKRGSAANTAGLGEAIVVSLALATVVLVAYFAYPIAFVIAGYGLIAAGLLALFPRTRPVAGLVTRKSLEHSKNVALWPNQVWKGMTR